MAVRLFGARPPCNLSRIFLPFWFGSVFLIGGVPSFLALVSIFTDRFAGAGSTGAFLIIPFGMLVFGYLLLRFGRYLARDEGQFLTDFLRVTLEAKDTAPRAPQTDPLPKRGT